MIRHLGQPSVPRSEPAAVIQMLYEHSSAVELLFSKAATLQNGTETSCPKGLVMMCGQFGALARQVSDWAEFMGAVLMIVGEKDLPLDWLRAYAPRLDLLLVDADYLGDNESTVEFCMTVRRAAPELPIILISSEIGAHDFTAERMMACDAALKPPLMRLALTMGAQAAYLNNENHQASRSS